MIGMLVCEPFVRETEVITVLVRKEMATSGVVWPGLGKWL